MVIGFDYHAFMRLIPVRTYQQKLRFYMTLMAMSMVTYILVRILVNINS
jgi:hypothetical protein